MQLFNGITMEKFKMFGIRFDGNGSEKPSKDVGDKKSEYEQILAQINEIRDSDDNTRDDIEGLDGILSSEVAKILTPNQAKELLGAIEKKFNVNENSETLDDIKSKNIPGLKDLIDFLEPIVDPLSKHVNVQFTVDNSVGKNLGKTVSESRESEKQNLTNRINVMINKIKGLSDARLSNIDTSLKNINEVLENPNKSNVKALQEFIWKVLNYYEDIRHDVLFPGKNYDKDKFCDGTLGNDTLAGLEEVLKKIKKYVDDVNEAIAVEKKADEAKKKSDGSKKVDNKGENAPVAPAPKPMESQILKTGGFGKSDKQVTFGSTVVALYSCKSSAGSSGSNAEGNDVDNRLDGAKIDTAQNTLKNLKYNPNGEQLYLMQTGNNVYMVRLDKGNCLYPFAVNLAEPDKPVLLENNTSCMQYLKNKVPDSISNDVTIGWKDRNYVIGKRGYDKWLTIEPMTIAGEWVSSDLSECLAFLNFTNYLRNEPGLDRNLSNGRLDGKFKNDNPDIELDDNGVYVKVKKMDKNDYRDKSEWKEYDRSRDYMNVNLVRFGLPDAKNEAWKNFKKYNNGEQWEDERHWEKMQKGKYKRASMQEDIYNAEIAARRKGGGGNVLGGGGGGGSPDVLSTGPVTLEPVGNDFNRSDFGISDGNFTVFACNGVYYYQDGNTVHQVTGFTDQTVDFSPGQSLSNGQDISNLNFSPVDKLKITEGGAEALNSKLKDVYRSIVDENLADGVKISVSADKKGYVLNFGENKSIPLGGEQFFNERNWQILGYSADKPEEWMKVVCYAVENYDDIISGKQLVLNNSNEYGITDNNKDAVNIWLQSLKPSDNSEGGNEKHDLVILPGNLDVIGTFDDKGKFTISSGVESDGKITIGGVEYSEYSKISGDAGGLGYKIDERTVAEGGSSRNENVFLLGEFKDGKLNGMGTEFFVNGKLEGDFANNEPKTGGNFAFTWKQSGNVLKYSKTEGENLPLSGTVTLKNNTILNVSRSSVGEDWVVSNGSSAGKKFNRLTGEEIIS